MTTIADIARIAGVSKGTVDRVLHNRGRVSKITEKVIQKIIKELDYRPNVFARQLSLSKIFKFGVLIPQPFQDGRFWELSVKGLKKATSEMNNIELEYLYYDKYSEDSFKEMFDHILDERSHYDGLIIAPVLSRVTEQLIQSIPTDLPYVFIDSKLPNSNALSYIGQESTQSGALAGRLMRLLLCDNGLVVIFKVIPEDYHINERINGFQSFLATHSPIKTIIVDADCKSDTGIFYKLTREVLSDNLEVRGFFVPNACVHQVAEYIKESKSPKKYYIIGYDLVSENRKYLKEGFIDFLISQRAETQSYEAVNTLYRHLVLSEKIPDTIIMPVDIIAPENVDFIL